MNELLTNNSKIEIHKFNNSVEYTNTLTKKTMQSYVGTIKEFFVVNELPEITIEQIKNVTPDIATAWANNLVDSGKCSPATANRKLSALQNFYSYLTRHSVAICEYNPFSTSEGCIRFKNAIKNYSDKRALSTDEVKNIFDSVDFPSDKISKYSRKWLLAQRDLIILQLLATTGMRRGEIVKIKLGNIMTVGEQHVCEITGKGEKRRLMVIAQPIYNNIVDYVTYRKLKMTDKEKPLITNHTSNGEENTFLNEVTVYRVVKKYASKAGIDVSEIAPHNFRHTFCTQSIELGANLNTVSDLMGHTSVSTTKRYEHTLRTIKESTSNELSNLYGL